MKQDVWGDFGFARLQLRQGDYTLVLPIYQDMQSTDGMETMGRYLDGRLLAAAGHVLPTREWSVLQG
jgi:hypothetical protein